MKNFNLFMMEKLSRLRYWAGRPGVGLLARPLAARYLNGESLIPVPIHGRVLWLNPGNTYPQIVHDAPEFNAPLVELVNQCAKFKGRPVTFVDVGSATGDSIYLIEERCPGKVGKYLCIEGDAQFFGILTKNTSDLPNVQRIHVLLAREPRQIPTLVKHHGGTAAAIGSDTIAAVPLDSLPDVANSNPDIIKIDIDGFDGEALAGARRILAQSGPAVIFEWHPRLIGLTGNHFADGFQTLSDCGYTRFLWFDNFGTFSHFTGPCDLAELSKMRDYLLRVNDRQDEHFDVIALPAQHGINDVELAVMEHARGWGRSRRA